jgi:heme-degrading monooxygenase HmoA
MLSIIFFKNQIMISTFHIGTLYAKPEYLESLLQSFSMLSTNPGYIKHSCFQDQENPNKIALVKEWEPKEDHLSLLSRDNTPPSPKLN